MTRDVEPIALEKNDLIYEALKSRLGRTLAEGPEAALHHVERMAGFALYHHPGRFADGAVENVAFRVGRSLEGAPSAVPALDARILRDPRATVLHVANRVHAIGGHTRLIGKCLATDPESVHVLVLTDQRDEVPPFLEQSLERAGGQLIVLAPGDSRVERARQLRSIARACDRVFIVTHPQDSIPVVAFAADDLPPVALSNHAHFSFCLGSTVADLIVNHIPYHLELVTRPFRFARNAEMLLFFPGLAPFDTIDKAAAKRALGFSEGDVVLLAMAFTSYWSPTRDYDFFRTARQILALDPRVHIVMVGPDPGDPKNHQRVPDSPRFHLRGLIADPVPYYQAADAALESFPIPSPGSVVEAVAYGGAYPILKYGPGESILCFDLPVLSSFVARARDEGGYIAQVKALLDALPEHRRGATAIREAIIAFDRAWPARLQAMYASLDAMGHQPREIPTAPCSHARDSQVLAEINFGPWAPPATLPAYITVPEFTPAEYWHYYQLAAEKGCLRPEELEGAVAQLASERASFSEELQRLRGRMDDA